MPSPANNDVSRLQAELAAIQTVLEQSQAERARLEEALEGAVAGERRRLAKALHDSVNQTLTGIYFQAQVMVKKMENSSGSEMPAMTELADMIHEAVVELSKLTRELQTSAHLAADVPAAKGDSANQPSTRVRSSGV